MAEEQIIKGLNSHDIQQYQQNRYPCFFVDWIEEARPGKSAKGHKNFTFNEWFFPGHFKDDPNVPGFIQIEVLTQVFLMTFLTFPEYKGKKTGFVTIKNARFKKKIIPGQRLDVIATLDSFRRGLAQGKAVGYIKDEIACQLELVITIPDVMKSFCPTSSKE